MNVSVANDPMVNMHEELMKKGEAYASRESISLNKEALYKWSSTLSGEAEERIGNDQYLEAILSSTVESRKTQFTYLRGSSYAEEGELLQAEIELRNELSNIAKRMGYNVVDLAKFLGKYGQGHFPDNIKFNLWASLFMYSEA